MIIAKGNESQPGKTKEPPSYWQLDGETVFQQIAQRLEQIEPGTGEGDVNMGPVTQALGEKAALMLKTSADEDAAIALKAFEKQTSYGFLRSRSVLALVRVPGFETLTAKQRDFITQTYLYALSDQARTFDPLPSRFGLAMMGTREVIQFHRFQPNSDRLSYPKIEPPVQGKAARAAAVSFLTPGAEPRFEIKRFVPLTEDLAKQMMLEAAKFSSLRIKDDPTAEGEAMTLPPKTAAATAALPTPMREWKSADGRMMKASLIRFIDDSHAEFKREDGALFTVGFDKLSAEGQDELRKLSAPPPEIEQPAPPSVARQAALMPETVAENKDAATSATKEAPFVNSLGMIFVPVPETKILLCIHETRKRDYLQFFNTDPTANKEWLTRAHSITGVRANPGDDYPVAFVNWDEAKAFCRWLSAKERRRYRLPTDHEWSCAAGLAQEDPVEPPNFKSGKSPGIYPWGTDFPPKALVGNLADETSAPQFPKWTKIAGYNDRYVHTAPVMSFPANALGLHDLSGNVGEWCSDDWSPGSAEKVYRGASYAVGSRSGLSSDYRAHHQPHERWTAIGFRVVLELRSD